MNKKAKFIITSLTAACAAFASFGFTACKPTEKPPVGGDDDDRITYVGKAVDDSNNPVADVWLAIGYVKEESYTQLAYAKTETNGEAKFYGLPENSKTKGDEEFIEVEGVTAYELRLADGTASKGIPSGQRLVPYSYVLKVNTQEGISAEGTPYTYVVNETFNAEKTATLTFNYKPNNYFNAEIKDLQYSRGYKDYDCAETPANIVETKADYVVQLTAGVYNYFNFSPYVKPEGASKNDYSGTPSERENLALAETQRRLDRASKAAAGNYKVSFTTTSSANVTMYNYGNNVFSVDDEGIPTYSRYISGTAPSTATAAEAELYTGENAITLVLNTDYVKGNNCFGIKADANCTVTVTAERTGDAREIETTVVKHTVNANDIVKEDDVSGTLTSLNSAEYLDGTTPVEKGADGWYVNGKRVYVKLAVRDNNISADFPLNQLHKQSFGGEGSTSQRGEGAYIFTETIDAYTKKQHNFYELVTKYTAEKCNSDGMYRLTDELQLFLTFYNFPGLTPDQRDRNNWLIACYYYA